ncbi:MAG: ATP phosphoribosyltransferase [Spirochaetales bacterium]|nr:ATP phosphoribosyltransferase [Spirochaetales bacterium]
MKKLSTIKIAIPNKGRLRDPSLELLKAAGYRFRIKERMLYATCSNAGVTLIFLRADDIPLLVASGIVDLGITGQDLVREKNAKIKEILPLELGKCRLCVAVSDNFKYKNPASLDGKRIATSFPNITKSFFKKNRAAIDCLEMSGALEITVGLGLADAIVDIVETGDTLRENKLRVVEDIGTYQTSLIGNAKSALSPEVKQIRRRLEGILIARRYSMLEYNIKKELFKKAETITPGFEAPTVSEIDEAGWCAVKVMVEKKQVIEVMDRLESLGATAILETEIKNCRL